MAVAPNLWSLSGGGITIRYSTAGTGNFLYHDSVRTVTFTGPQIEIATVPALGTLVSVVVFLTVDSGSTTFTILLPPTNLNPPTLTHTPVTTDGITTHHHFSVVPTFNLGQQAFYAVVPMTGTASHV